MTPRILLEVAVASVEDALAAQAGGADRLELNAALALGGLTPTPGLLHAVRDAVALPLVVMLRPRPSGFCYSRYELAVMERDLEWIGDLPVAVGVLTEGGEIDAQAMRRFVRPDTVCHRAFDLVPDPFAALERLIDLGIRRVMTSGQAATAAKGADRIARLVDAARGRIEILPAAGIRPENVRDLIARTGCDQVHASLRGSRTDPSMSHHPGLRFGTDDADTYAVTDIESVRRMRAALEGER